MSDGSSLSRVQLADIVGLRIQEFRANGLLHGAQPLLRIDNREQARRAPFQLDAATGKLHRLGCRSIPNGSRSALYGIWRIGRNDKPLTCPRCKPMPPTDDKKEDPEYPTDLLYGVLSVLNQFGGVLRERGQEYRNSPVGKVLGEQIGAMYHGINERERNVLDVILTSIDGLASTLRNLDADLNAANGAGAPKNGAGATSANGHDMKHDMKKDHRSTGEGRAQRHQKAARDRDHEP
jgi:hypothetical protein